MREPDKSRKGTWWRLRAACAALARDRDGSALFYTTLSLPVLIGFAVLAIDGSRFMNLNSTLQHAADGLALAAAGELDRKPDACERAERALAKIVQNDQLFGDVGDPRFIDLGPPTITVDDVTWRFLETLPANDWDPILEANEGDCDTAENAALVRYIEVWVKPQNFSTLFPASFVGGSNTASTNAVAVAGFDAAVCDFMPLFICNPVEEMGMTIQEAADDPDIRGRQMQIRKIGPSGSVGPGNYGFLQPQTKPGKDALKEMMGMDKPPACFLQDGVEVETGAVAAVGPWVNTRFDLYEKSASQAKNKPKYRPALNVRKGYTYTGGGTCNQSPDEDAMGLPRDNCLEDGTCPYMGGSMGDGTWDFDAYWDANFAASGAIPPVCDGSCSTNPPSRYEMYLYELANGMVPTASAPAGETGTPVCQATTDDSVDRRLLYGAVINCIEHEDKLVGGSGGKIPVEGFVELFITEPVKNAATEDSEDTNVHDIFWLELVRIVGPGPGSVARDRVQLYR